MDISRGISPNIYRETSISSIRGSMPSPEPMQLTPPEPGVLVDECSSTQTLDPTQTDIAVGPNYHGDDAEPVDFSGGSDGDEDWFCDNRWETSSLCGSASDFTLLSRGESPATSPVAQHFPVSLAAAVPAGCANSDGVMAQGAT
jgi:hypothetical protein